MKLQVASSMQEAKTGERALLAYLGENMQDRALISTILDQTDLDTSIHQRIYVAILEVSVDTRGNAIGNIQELLTSRGDDEAATYLSSLTAVTAEQKCPQSWAEALALAVRLVLLAALRRALDSDVDVVDDYLW